MKLTILVFTFISLFLLGACQSDDQNGDTINSVETIEETNEERVEMTLTELALFDGRNGNKAYIAVNGVIYDVTSSSLWRNGSHNGYQAGQDLTAAIASSPHGTSTLSRFPIVGYLVEKK
jgi:predicted heme/steroid binding protein